MKIIITIDTANAAFDDAPATEVARILRDAAVKIEQGELPPILLRDFNGNTVGEAHVTGGKLYGKHQRTFTRKNV